MPNRGGVATCPICSETFTSRTGRRDAILTLQIHTETDHIEKEVRKMSQHMNIPEHNLRRVVLPEVPRKDRVNKVDRPETAYACTCGVGMTSSYSRRQARRMHKLHRLDVLTEAFKQFSKVAQETGKTLRDASGRFVKRSVETTPAV